VNADDHVKDFLAGKKEFDVNSRADRYRLGNADDLTLRQKLAHYRSPDYCIVTRADTVYLLLSQLHSLVARGGVYYSVYD